MDVESTPPGFGRIDAFGGARNLLFESHTRRAESAPVSYPHLWNFERVSWLHWDANTTSVLERNIGQALRTGCGVRSHVARVHRVGGQPASPRGASPRRIKPPRWEDAVQTDRRCEGHPRRTVVHGALCVACHAAGAEVEAEFSDIGTDPHRAVNFAAPVGTVANDRAIADVVGNIKRKAFDGEKGLTRRTSGKFMLAKRPSPRAVRVWRVTSRYVARPLIGTWATAPFFFRNNSVPTLAHRDAPAAQPEQRPAQFHVGSAEYDTERLGFVTTAGPVSRPARRENARQLERRVQRLRHRTVCRRIAGACSSP